jgi:hypothetical protein
MNRNETTKEVRRVWLTDEEIEILLDLLQDSEWHNKEMFDCEVELCHTLYTTDESEEDEIWLPDKSYSILQATLFAMLLLSCTLFVACLV